MVTTSKEKAIAFQTSLTALHNRNGQSQPGSPPDIQDDIDPRNWSQCKKRMVFVALMSSSILCDGGLTWGNTLIVPQAIEWNISVPKSANSITYGVLLAGIGGVLFTPLINTFGRYPCWVWPQLITLGVVTGSCFAGSFEVYYALRTLQGLFSTVPQVIGLPIIYDMYTPAQWPKYINIWGTTFLLGPSLGPAIAGYFLEATKSWRATVGILAGLYTFSSILVLVFGCETYYVRSTRTQQTSKVKTILGIGNTRLPKIQSLKTSSWEIIRLAFLTPPLLLVGLSSMVNCTWPIGITVTFDTFIHAPPYLFGNVEGASMRFAPVIGSLLGFVAGSVFNHWIYNGSGGKRRADWRPEFRLHGVWLPLTSMVFGLLIYGLTLANGRSWVALAIGWGMVFLGLIGSTVAITAFALDKYRNHATVVSAIINGWRTTAGFSVAFFQPPWIARSGIAVVFGVQAAVVGACAILLISPVIWMGRRKARQSELAVAA